MEPKFVTKPAFTVVGLKSHGKNENNEIPETWTALMPRMEEIPVKPDSEYSYGVCGNMTEDGSFDYLAGFEVADDAEVPEGMARWDVPEQRYAVFTCTLPTVREAYDYIYNTWLPQSEYEHAPGPEFEAYGETFNYEDPESKMELFVPVVKK